MSDPPSNWLEVGYRIGGRFVRTGMRPFWEIQVIGFRAIPSLITKPEWARKSGGRRAASIGGDRCEARMRVRRTEARTLRGIHLKRFGKAFSALPGTAGIVEAAVLEERLAAP